MIPDSLVLPAQRAMMGASHGGISMTMMMQRPESTVRVEVLGAELRRLREAAGMTLQDASERVGLSLGQLSKLETGKRTQRLEDVASLLTIYRVFGDERRDLLEMVRNSTELGYWEKPKHSSYTSRVATLRLLESRASALFNFETVLIPGYLQTVPYMRAVIRGATMIDDEEEIDRRVVTRIQRQTGSRRGNVDVTAIVCESALRARIGGRVVMRDQLTHLIEAAQRPNVKFLVVPTTAGAHPGLEGGFIRLRFPDRPGVVFVGCATSSLFLEEPDDIERYKAITGQLLRLALDPGGSVELVASIAAALG
jgi:transcriptional regulator with XRE-family HTH domain